ncbi:MAG: bifunctional oligoribonuclease/PAP phosphatase NrnA [Epsilonproteobacteria bacterium]|nr:bifunctional oligoribonuclease/PAP phosphatase NrnA [Campylobacterota bacterium]NPA56713.1 bifunctional oligoribonuclease/PAP phosphatase NrnA [Campylobacterota bacterium]
MAEMEDLYRKVWEMVEEADSLLLATHINPDADTIGSALALYHLLKGQGKSVTLYNRDPLPYNLDFLPGSEKIGRKIPDSFDLLITLDAASWDRLGLDPVEQPIINIDHHISNTLYGTLNIVDPGAAATAQVLYNLIKSRGLSLPREGAVPLYTALVDDSGFFRYERVDGELFQMAAQLCQWGADPHSVAKNLTMREPLAKLRLTEMVLATLRLHLYGKVGIITMTQEMLKRSGATKEMGDGVLDMVRSLATVQVALLFREEEDGRIKVSLRSKDSVDVGKIASEFGGGGHKNSAGFTDGKDLNWIERELLQRLEKEIVVEE